MRYHEPFTLLPRKFASSDRHKHGIVVWYYRARNPDGTRTSAWSTGQTANSAAKAYCRQLEKEGKLIPERECPAPVKELTFADLALNFWTWDKSDRRRT